MTSKWKLKFVLYIGFSYESGALSMASQSSGSRLSVSISLRATVKSEEIIDSKGKIWQDAWKGAIHYMFGVARLARSLLGSGSISHWLLKPIWESFNRMFYTGIIYLFSINFKPSIPPSQEVRVNSLVNGAPTGQMQNGLLKSESLQRLRLSI